MSEKANEPTSQDFWVVLFILLVTSPITAFFDALIAAKVWDLLLSTQYGPGPTYQTWYGISVLSAWILNGSRRRDVDKKDAETSWAIWAITKLGVHLTYGGLVLVVVGLVRLLFGWH